MYLSLTGKIKNAMVYISSHTDQSLATKGGPELNRATNIINALSQRFTFTIWFTLIEWQYKFRKDISDIFNGHCSWNIIFYCEHEMQRAALENHDVM